VSFRGLRYFLGQRRDVLASLRMFEGHRFCGVNAADAIQAQRTGPARWDSPRIGWVITGGLPGVTSQLQRMIYALAWESWAGVPGCGLEVAESPNGTATQLVLMGSGPIDGPGGVLAHSELPQPRMRQLKQKYGTHERWFAALVDRHPAPSELISLLAVAAHEIGHALGLPHSGDSTALMAPTYNPRIWSPQADDAREIVRRYPQQGPPTSPPGERVVTIRVEGLPPGYSARLAA